jgi:signal transduction histidine kinase
MGFIAAALADSIYGTWVNILAVSDTRGTVIELLYNIPFNLFLTCMALAMLRMTTRKSSRLAGQIFGLITLGALLLFYFYFSTVKTESTQTAVLTGWSIISESAILLAAGIFFLFGTNIATQLIASGLLVICSTNLLLQYLEFSGQMIPGIPFEAVWVLGQISILLGAIGFLNTTRTSEKIVAFNFQNTRARFVLSLVGLIMGLHICWQMFFVSLGGSQNSLNEILLSIIFVSITFLPITILFKSLFIKPVMSILENIYNSRSESSALNVDHDLREMGDRVVKKMVEAERAKIAADAHEKLAMQVAHDIRSPLSALDTVVLLSNDLSGESRKLVLQATKRIREIATELLSKHQTPSDGINVRSENLTAVIENVLIEKAAEQRLNPNIEITASIEKAIPSKLTSSEAADLSRVLSNLINNAKDAIGNSGHIEINALTSSAGVEISIEDNGHGIPTEFIPRIFSRGFTYGKTSGTGLGLSSAKEKIESMGGQINFHSKVNQGSRVTIYLPV